MSELTGQQIWKLLAESFEDKSDDESISIGAWSKVPKSELTPWNMPEFSGRMSLTMAEVRKYATEQPADPPADREQDDEPLDTPEFTAALEADYAKWLAGRVARREQVRREAFQDRVNDEISAELRRLADSGGSGNG